MKTRTLLIVGILLVHGWFSTAPGASALPTRIMIEAQHSSWGVRSTNLTLVLSNGFYRAGSISVAPGLVSNLVTAAQLPWPQVGSNTWPHFSLNYKNLGLTAEWAKTNQERLLTYFSSNSTSGPFPNVSDRQRQWLTNTLAEVHQLEACVQARFEGVWTDDYPSLSLQFQNRDEHDSNQLLQISTKSQWPFLLPWNIQTSSNWFVSGNVEISRAVAAILPADFLLRDRLDCEVAQLVEYGFWSIANRFLIESTLEETFGASARLPHGFQLSQCWITSGGGPGRIPEGIQLVAHRTNWPSSLTAPVSSRIRQGVATNLSTALAEAQAKADRLLQHAWLRQCMHMSTNVSVQISEASPDKPWMRTHMDKAGLGEFYNRIQPAFQRAIGFRFSEVRDRSSEWALFEDGRLLLFKFAGNGVLDWSPEQLGYPGDVQSLNATLIQTVAVLVDSQGQIVEVIHPQKN